MIIPDDPRAIVAIACLTVGLLPLMLAAVIKVCDWLEV